jgi:asparagine synthase (glutamine-hydrolysing)
MSGIAGYAGVADQQWLDLTVETETRAYHSAHDAVHMAASSKNLFENEHCTIAFDGAIMNAPELRRELEARGKICRHKDSDAELLLLFYELDGEAMVERLNGMFAFVIHDVKRRILFGARDHAGIKALNYAIKDGKFAFGSDIRAVKRLPWIRSDLDYQSISDYLSFQTFPVPRTIYADIAKLGAGWCFTYGLSRGEFSVRQFWMPPVDRYRHSPITGDRPEMLERIRASFLEASDRWTTSNDAIGYLLSGGIDSAALAGAAASRGRPVVTYTVGFSDASDEHEQARMVAQQWGTTHREILMQSDDLLTDLDALFGHLAEPYAGTLVPWFAFKAMREGIGVTGIGGDELFGNYGKWIARDTRTKRLSSVRKMLRRGGRVRDSLSFPDGSIHCTHFPDPAKRYILKSGIRRGLRPSAGLMQGLQDASPDPHQRSRIAYADFRLQLPEEFLFMNDRFSSAFGIQSRTPFLDREFIDTVFSLPPDVRSSRAALKGVFLEAVGDLLPPQIAQNPVPSFRPPIGEWLRGPLKPMVKELFDRQYLKTQGIFSAEVIPRYVRPHIDGKRNRDWQLWTLLGFQLWYEKEIRGNDLRS